MKMPRVLAFVLALLTSAGAAAATTNPAVTGVPYYPGLSPVVNGLLVGNGTTYSAYAGTTCADSLVRSLAASGAAVCSQVANADLAGSIAASKLVGTDIATLGTITSGTWNGTVVSGLYGGTGVANSGKTITLGGNLTTSGAFATTFTTTATTNVTLPTTGTLATLAGAEAFTNKTLTGPTISGGTTDATVNNVINVRSYLPCHVYGDGSTDDTTCLNTIIATGSNVRFTSGSAFIISAPLLVQSNQEIVIDGGASIKSKAATSWAALGMIHINGKSNVVIRGPGKIDGNRANNSTGQAFGIAIIGASVNVLVDGVECVSIPSVDVAGTTGGDCVRIGRYSASAVAGDTTNVPSEITVRNMRINDAYRNSIGVISGKRVSILNNSVSGTVKLACIDVEPNNVDDVIYDLIIVGNHCSGDIQGIGLSINNNPVSVRGILVDGNTVEATTSASIGYGVFVNQNSAARTRLFFSSGNAQVARATTITGATSSATCVVDIQEVYTGTYAGSDAAGRISCASTTGTFTAAENLQVSGVTKAVLGANITGTSPAAPSVSISDDQGIIVSNNIIRRAGFKGIYVVGNTASHGVLVQGNRVISSVSNQIEMNTTTRPSVIGNQVFFESSTEGIYCNGCVGPASITGNVVTHYGAGNGMHITNSTDVAAAGNTTTNIAASVAGTGIRISGTGTGHTITGNRMRGWVRGIRHEVTSSIITGNELANNTTPLQEDATGTSIARRSNNSADASPVAIQAENSQNVAILQLTELTTIAAAATTDTAIQIPAGAIVLAVSVRVTVAIPTATTFTVGDAGSAARYSTAAVSVAANSTNAGTAAGAYYNASAAAIRITPNGTPAANTGRLRVTIFYFLSTPPTS